MSQPSFRPKGRPAKAEATELTERIVETAAVRFLEDGFEATSMDAVAAEAGISKRTLYARFRSKSLLLQAVADHLFVETRSEFTPYADRTDAAEIVLREMAHHMHRRVLMPFCLDIYRLMVSQSQRQRQDAGLMLGADRYLVPLVSTLTTQFRRAAEAGEITNRWDVRLLAEQFLESVCGWDLRRMVFGGDLASEADVHRSVVDQRFELFFAALRPVSATLTVADGGSLVARSRPSDAAAPPRERDRKQPPRYMSGSRRSY